MLNTADMLPRKLVSFGGFGSFLPLLILTLFASLFLLPAAGFAAQDSPAQDSPEVGQLKQKAQDAFVKGDYAAAAKFDLEIAEKHPDSAARRYAIQMLGTIYEDDLVDVKKAVKWDREYLEKYADSRQAPFYQEKLATLEKLVNQEQAFKTYQSIRSAPDGDEAMAKKFETLLKEHPDFLFKEKVLREIGNAYGRLDERKRSALAFQAIASQGDKKLSIDDQIAYNAAHRYWQMRTTWAWVAWGLIAMPWAVVLWMKPWQRLTWTSARKFLLWPVLWLLMACAAMPFFYSMETAGYPIKMPAVTVYIAIGLNLIVLFWLLLLLHGASWLTRPRMLRWLTPVLALLMTTGVFYLFVAYQPNGPYIVDECVVKYNYWNGELRQWEGRRHNVGQAAVQDK